MTLERNHVYNMNCLDGIRQMIAQDMHVDCVITDPPYLIDYKTHRRQDKQTRRIKRNRNPHQNRNPIIA